MNHLVQLVDKYDTLLGYKYRDDLDDSDTWRIVCIHITNPTGTRILLQKRSARKKQNPGLWTIAGTLEKEDTYESAAYRELEEELSFTGVQLVDQGNIYLENVSLGKRYCQLYSVALPEDTTFTLQVEEVERIEWFSLEEVRDWFEKKPEMFGNITFDVFKKLGIIQ